MFLRTTHSMTEIIFVPRNLLAKILVVYWKKNHINKDMIKSPPAEKETMKKATLIGMGCITLVNCSIGIEALGNMLAGFYDAHAVLQKHHPPCHVVFEGCIAS